MSQSHHNCQYFKFGSLSNLAKIPCAVFGNSEALANVLHTHLLEAKHIICGYKKRGEENKNEKWIALSRCFEAVPYAAQILHITF